MSQSYLKLATPILYLDLAGKKIDVSGRKQSAGVCKTVFLKYLSVFFSSVRANHFCSRGYFVDLGCTCPSLLLLMFGTNTLALVIGLPVILTNISLV